MVKKITKFAASDGTEFDTKAEAIAHDAGHKFDKLIGLTADDLTKIAARDPAYRLHCDALEALANQVTRARRAAGELQRPYAGRPAVAPLQQAAE